MSAIHFAAYMQDSTDRLHAAFKLTSLASQWASATTNVQDFTQALGLLTQARSIHSAECLRP